MKIVTLSAIILVSAVIIAGAIIYTNKNKSQLNSTGLNSNAAINDSKTKSAEDKAQQIKIIENEITLAKANVDNYKKLVDSTTAQINEVNKRPAECQKLPASMYFPCYSSYQTEFNRLTGLSKDYQDKEQQYVNECAQLYIKLYGLSK